MSGWDDYYEPSEFDEAMMEFKQTIIDNVRQEIKDKIQRLEKENEELRDIKVNWQKINAEHQNALFELRVKTEQAELKAKRDRAMDIIKQMAFVGYRPSCEYKTGPKCDKCDENRKIHFVSPMGRQMTEDCLCAKRFLNYSPREEKLFKVYAGGQIGSMYYTISEETRDYDTWSMCGDVYRELPEKLEDINPYRAVFFKEEDCRKYCDWKNKKEREENERKTGA